MNLSDLFGKLDEAVGDMNSKLKTFNDLNSQATTAYQNYLDARKIADGIRGQLQTQLGSIIPEQPADRAVVR